MKTNKTIFTFFLLFLLMITLPFKAEGNEKVFKVLIVDGNIEVIRNSNETVKIYPGHELFSKDTILAVGDIYLCLYHKAGVVYEINQPGKYSVRQIEATFEVTENNFVSKYVDFLVDAIKEDS